MKTKTEKTCNICLKVVQNKYWLIDELMNKIFQALLLELNSAMMGNLVICKDCVEIAKKCLQFKHSLIFTQSSVVSIAYQGREAKYNTRHIYQKYDAINYKTVIERDLNVCGFCMVPRNKYKCVSLDALDELILKLCPEIDMNIIANPIICKDCKDILQIYFKLAINVFHMKERINARIKQDEKMQRNNASGSIKITQKLPNQEDIDKYKTCPICFVKFKYKSMLKRHMISHQESTEAILYECTNCPFKTKYKNNLQYHMNGHGTHFYECSICPYKTKHKYSLKTHTLTHKTSEKRVTILECPICHLRFKKKGNLTRHMLIVHKEGAEMKQPLKCDDCSFKAKHKKNLLYHIFYTHGKETYTCQFCRFMCTHEDILKKHMNHHEKFGTNEMQQLFECDHCFFKTKYKRNLVSHMARHRDKTYVCPFCHFRCTHEHSFKKHVAKHEMLNDVIRCSKCSYKFHKNIKFERHMLKAHKELYKCSKCPFESDKKSLQSHKLSVHVSKTFECPICNCAFKQRDLLTNHIVTH